MEKNWRPGKGNRTTVLKDYGTVRHNGRAYRFVQLETAGGLIYDALRLYNADNHFIKSFMFEPEIAAALGSLILKGEDK